jgi:hypothetical protein
VNPSTRFQHRVELLQHVLRQFYRGRGTEQPNLIPARMSLNLQLVLDQTEIPLSVAVEFGSGQVVVKSDDFLDSGGSVAQCGLP